MNRNTTIVLVIIFAALGLVALWVQRREGSAAQGTPTPGVNSTKMWDITPEQIAGVRIVDRVKNRSVAFAKDAQGIWAVTEPEARAADQALASSAAGGFANLYVSTTITNTTDLAPFGVLSPTYTLEVKLMDGSQLKASIGDKTPTGSTYYIWLEGGPTVVVVDSGTIDGLVASLDSPPYFVPTATPGPTVVVTTTVLAPAATASATAVITPPPSPTAPETPAPASSASATSK